LKLAVEVGLPVSRPDGWKTAGGGAQTRTADLRIMRPSL
jgi:hypothetical protein